MISLQEYRVKIGSFVSEARHIQRSSEFSGKYKHQKHFNFFADTPKYSNI